MELGMEDNIDYRNENRKENSNVNRNENRKENSNVNRNENRNENRNNDSIENSIMSSIDETRKSFEASFKTDNFYNKQTRDLKHLESIMDCLEIKPGMRILDLGTGTGFLAFALAEKYPDTEVLGLDIVEKALCENRRRAEREGLHNLQFAGYDGMTFPFEDGTFDMVATRYALHHFPEITGTFQEINRVLKPKGTFFLSDPAPNDGDLDRFVDAYMQMKKDGHIKFYTKKEWQELGRSAGLDYREDFETSIRFPKKKAAAPEFDDIAAKYSQEVIKSYDVEIVDDEIWITERVNNLLFQKQTHGL